MVGGRTLCTTSGDEAPRPTSSAMVRTVHIGDVGRPRDSEGDELGLVFSEVNVLEESREVAHRGPDGYTSTAPTATHCRVLPYYTVGVSVAFLSRARARPRMHGERRRF